jgi:hypothetical protein
VPGDGKSKDCPAIVEQSSALSEVFGNRANQLRVFDD